MALEDLKSDIVELIDIYDLDEIMIAIQEAIERAAEIENQQDKIDLLKDLSESLEEFNSEFWE